MRAKGKGAPNQMMRMRPEDPGEERLNRFIAGAVGVSRREADRLVQDGRVTLNGKVIREPGTRLDPRKDAVKLSGKRVAGKAAPIYFILNKPRGVVCTMEDPEGRPCVGDILKRVKGHPVPAGRLDFESEGLILCTNEGDVIHRLIHPTHKVRKVYAVKVNGIPAWPELQKLRNGVLLDGKKTMPAGVYMTRQGKKNCWLQFTINEGRNRQIRRMVEKIGFRVLKLRRKALGPLKLTGLKPGDYRKLRKDEVRDLILYLAELDKQKIPAYNAKDQVKKTTRGRAVR